MGPKLYQGQHNPPQGPAPVVNETGEYEGKVATKYDSLKIKSDRITDEVTELVNKGWSSKSGVLEGLGGLGMNMGELFRKVIDALTFQKEIDEFRKLMPN